MKVERVYTRGLVGVPKSATLVEAAETMRSHHVGALLVTEGPLAGDAIIGILTDRDIVVQAIADGCDPNTLTAGIIMSPVVATVRDSADLHEALELMRAGGMRRLVVADGADTIVGILSIDDVIDGLAADLASLAALVKRGPVREAAAFEEMSAI